MKKLFVILFGFLLSELHSAPTPTEKPIAIVVASYNNAAFVQKNVESMLFQTYDNFRVIYIDDASTDGTLKLAKAAFDSVDRKINVQFVRNSVNRGPAHNQFCAINMCSDEEIVVILDGDDWFAHENVLATVNSYYSKHDIWMSWGSYVEYPSLAKGVTRPLKHPNSTDIRKHDWITSHLRTFYAALFKRIELKDFMKEDSFLKTTADLAAMIPMLEMARERSIYIPEVLYMYNTTNSLSECYSRSKESLENDRYIRELKPYKKLKALPLY